jgi:hypothetical protein
MGSSSHLGTLVIIPGMDMGTIEDALKHPALPNDAPSPGGFGSMIVTLNPRRWSINAVHTPTTPAPMTPIDLQSLSIRI